MIKRHVCVRNWFFMSLASFVISGCASPVPKTAPQLQYELDDNGCYIGEQYDATNDSCYLDCTNLDDAQCDTLSMEFYGEFDEFIDDEFDGHDDSSTSDENSREIAIFSVNKQLTLEKIINDEPENEQAFQEIWSVVLSILPESVISEEVVEFHVSTDGVDNTLAFVNLNEDNIEKWNIAIDPADYTDGGNKDFIHTVIHEFAHIAFLKRSQIKLNDNGACNTYSITEGCTLENSYLHQFYTRFWADIIQDNPSALADEDAQDEDEVYEFYEKYSTHFVSDYAATNPVEDVAEVFVRFVLENKPSVPQNVAQEKVAFLHQFPKLLEFRNTIRNKLKKRRSVALITQ